MKKAFIFIGGVVTGGVAAFLGATAYYKRLLNTEIEDLVDYYDNVIDELEQGKKVEEIGELDGEPESEDIVAKEEPTTLDAAVSRVVDEVREEDVENYEEIIDNLNYNRYSTKKKSSGKKRKKTAEPVEKEDKFIISTDEFNDDMKHEKVDCIYYSEDGVLMFSDTDEVCEDIEREVGYSNLEQFGNIPGFDSDELYIRNDFLGRDYHIFLESDISYGRLRGEDNE